MNLIQTIFESINKACHQLWGDIPYDIETYVIGSGGNFEVHEFITSTEARKLYEKYKKRLSLGKRQEIKDVGCAVMESWHTQESNTGITYTLMFKVSKVFRYDPNKVIDEWNEKTGNLKRITKDETK